MAFLQLVNTSIHFIQHRKCLVQPFFFFFFTEWAISCFLLYLLSSAKSLLNLRTVVPHGNAFKESHRTELLSSTLRGLTTFQRIILKGEQRKKKGNSAAYPSESWQYARNKRKHTTPGLYCSFRGGKKGKTRGKKAIEIADESTHIFTHTQERHITWHRTCFRQKGPRKINKNKNSPFCLSPVQHCFYASRRYRESQRTSVFSEHSRCLGNPTTPPTNGTS